MDPPVNRRARRRAPGLQLLPGMFPHLGCACCRPQPRTRQPCRCRSCAAPRAPEVGNEGWEAPASSVGAGFFCHRTSVLRRVTALRSCQGLNGIYFQAGRIWSACSALWCSRRNHLERWIVSTREPSRLIFASVTASQSQS